MRLISVLLLLKQNIVFLYCTLGNTGQMTTRKMTFLKVYDSDKIRYFMTGAYLSLIVNYIDFK